MSADTWSIHQLKPRLLELEVSAKRVQSSGIQKQLFIKLNGGYRLRSKKKFGGKKPGTNELCRGYFSQQKKGGGRTPTNVCREMEAEGLWRGGLARNGEK